MYNTIEEIDKRIAELKSKAMRLDAEQYAYKILANSKSK